MTFDKIAPSYDQTFSHTRTGQWLRQCIWQRMDHLFSPPMRILELGCGTGEDAVHLAQRGVKVLATDASPAMLDITRQKAERHGVSIQTQLFDLNQPNTWRIEQPIDGVMSNFGALNCTPHWGQLATFLADHLAPGAKLGFALMGRFCLWESLWHGMHLDWHTATRRWRGHTLTTLDDGSVLPVFYPAPHEIIKAFAPQFVVNGWVGIGAFLPTSDSFAVVEKHPRLWRTLTNLEIWLAHRKIWRAMADHYWIEFTRKDEA